MMCNVIHLHDSDAARQREEEQRPRTDYGRLSVLHDRLITEAARLDDLQTLAEDCQYGGRLATTRGKAAGVKDITREAAQTLRNTARLLSAQLSIWARDAATNNNGGDAA